MNQLVEDVFLDSRPLNIDKLFKSQDSKESSISHKGNFHGFENFKPKKGQKKNANEDSIFMLSPEFIQEKLDDDDQSLHRLFEDPDEKQLKIQKSIARS